MDKKKFKVKFHNGEDAFPTLGYAVIVSTYLDIQNEDGNVLDRWEIKDLQYDPVHLDKTFLKIPSEPDARIEMLDKRLAENIKHLKKTNMQEFFVSKKFLYVGIISILLGISLVTYFIDSISLKIAQLVPEKIERKIFSNINIDQYFSVCPNEDQQVFQEEINRFFYSKTIDSVSLDFISKIRIIKDPIVNAFVFPDGTIFITEKLIKQSESYDEIMGVIGHELGHLKYRHHMQSLVRSSFVGLFIGALSGDFSVFLVDPSIVAGIYNLKYSRQLESQADIYAVEFLKKLELSHQGMIHFFKKMDSVSQDEDGKKAASGNDKKWRWTQFLSSHPLGEDRIEEIKNLSLKVGLSNNITILNEELRTFNCH